MEPGLLSDQNKSFFEVMAKSREWKAQELAARSERGEGPENSGDRLAVRYQLFARVLADSALEPMPEDFATQTATLVEAYALEAGDHLIIWTERADGIDGRGGHRYRHSVWREMAIHSSLVRHQNLEPTADVNWGTVVSACLTMPLVFDLFSGKFFTNPGRSMRSAETPDSRKQATLAQCKTHLGSLDDSRGGKGEAMDRNFGFQMQPAAGYPGARMPSMRVLLAAICSKELTQNGFGDFIEVQ